MTLCIKLGLRNMGQKSVDFMDDTLTGASFVF